MAPVSSWNSKAKQEALMQGISFDWYLNITPHSASQTWQCIGPDETNK